MMRQRFGGCLLASSALVCCAATSTAALATSSEIGPADNFVAAMQGLQPGDTLTLDGGTYTLNGFFSLSLTGTAALPIVIRAKDGQQPVIQQLNASDNVFTISASYLTLDGLEITGNGIGIRFNSGDHITVRDCHIHDTTAEAITASLSSSVYAQLALIHNEIDHVTGGTGVGIYLGCSNDDCRVHDSLVADNYLHDLNAAGAPLGIGIFVRHGGYANVIQDNVVRDTLGPAIATADVNGHGGANIVERNLVWNVPDSGIQVGSDSIVRNNIVLNSTGPNAIAVAYSLVTPANVSVVNNTVLSSFGGVRVVQASGPVTIANNAIYAPSGNAIQASTTGAGSVTSTANAGQGALSGVAGGFAATGNLASDFFSASLSGVPPQNLLPRGTLLPGAADAGTLAADDFYATLRAAQSDIGAYRANADGNPGWPLQAGFKVLDEIFVGNFQASP